MNTLTFSQYCHNKTEKLSLPFAKGKFTYKGKKYTKKQIDKLLPTDLPLVNANDRKTGKDANSNKKVNFINGIKSY